MEDRRAFGRLSFQEELGICLYKPLNDIRTASLDRNNMRTKADEEDDHVPITKHTSQCDLSLV